MPMNATELARGLFKVLESGDAALADTIVGAEFANREAAVAPAACSQFGPAGVLASSAWMRSAFSDLHFSVLGTAHNDTQVWVRLMMQGRHTGPFVRYREGELDQAIPPTGKRIDFEQIHVLSVSEDKVVAHEAVRDDLTMLGQLGVFPPNPSVGLRMLAWKVSGHAKRTAREITVRAAQAAATADRRTA
jgi:predicted ester cyclase